MKDDIICFCRNVSRADIQEAIEKRGAKSILDIQWTTEACKDHKCGKVHPEGTSCEDEVKKMIVAHHGHCVEPEKTCSCCS